MNLERIASELGTPAFVYNFAHVKRQIELLQAGLRGEAELWYAAKANPFAELLRALNPLLKGLDVSSLGEVEHAVACGWSAERLSWSSPVKLPKDLRKLFDTARALPAISVESTSELECVLELARDRQSELQLSLRLQSPEVIKTFAVASGEAFGMPETEADHILSQVLPPQLPVGLHVHAGSQNRSSRGLTRHVTSVLDLADRLEQRHHRRFDRINFGGGLGVADSPQQSSLDAATFGEAAAKALASYQQHRGPRRFVFEPGRWLVAGAGHYVCRVQRTRTQGEHAMAWVDGGVHHLAFLRGEHPGARSPRAQALGLPSGRNHEVRGCSCSPFDRLATEVSLVDGGLVVFDNAGAYGLSASPKDFLGLPQPKELLVAELDS